MELATIQIEHFHLNYKPLVSAAYLDSSPACRCLYELVIWNVNFEVFLLNTQVELCI